MNKINTLRRTLGVDPDLAIFTLWAPYANYVNIFLPQNKTRLNLDKTDFGYWVTTEWAAGDGEQYWIEVDGKLLPDPASLFQPHGVDGPSEVYRPWKFPWQDHSWNNLPLSDYIIYELHVGAFTKEGTFSGIISKLQYLSELGITAIEVMPVAQFPGDRNWGYDGVFPFAVQNSYGGPLQLQTLINECHRWGIAVILDVVINHLGPEGNNMEKFGPYFTDKYKTPWGSAINFDDAGSDAVRKFYIENILMWLRDFHVDAIRLDAVHAIRDFGPTHILAEIRKYVDMLSSTTGKPHYLIAECDLNDAKFIKTLDQGGYGMNAQWIDEFHHALRVASGQPRTGYYSDFNGVEHLAKAFRSAYVYDGIYSPHRNRTFGSSADGLPGSSFVVFSQNHDQVGNRMLGERTASLLTNDQLKLLAVTVFASPFLPLLFMGEEYAETNPFLYFISHNGNELIEAVRKGRKKEFEHFITGEDFPDPQSEEVFERSKLSWSRLDNGKHKTLFSFYQELIRIRRSVEALRKPDRSAITVEVSNDDVVTIRRQHREGDVICLLNFSNQAAHVSLPDGSWNCLIYSAEQKWGGKVPPGNSLQNIAALENHSALIAIKAHV